MNDVVIVQKFDGQHSLCNEMARLGNGQLTRSLE